MELAAVIKAQRFTPVRMIEGYDMDEVDIFLDRAERAASAADADPTDAIVLLEELPSIYFMPVRFSEGYDMGEVDDFLDGVLAPGLADLIAGSGAGPVECARVAQMLTRSTPLLGRIGILTPLLTRASVDQIIADTVAALTGSGDESFRRRTAISILETASTEPHRGLAQGYVQQDVRERFDRALTLLRRS